MHNAKRVLKTIMHCTRVDLIGSSKLTDTPKSLKRGLFNNLALPIVQGDETVDRAANFVFLMWVHASAPSLRILYHTGEQKENTFGLAK